MNVFLSAQNSKSDLNLPNHSGVTSWAETSPAPKIWIIAIFGPIQIYSLIHNYVKYLEVAMKYIETKLLSHRGLF